MNKQSLFYKRLITVIGLFVLIVMAICLWPLQLLTHPTETAYPLNGDISTFRLGSGDCISFEFSTEDKHLNNIYFYPIIDAEQLDAEVVFQILDSAGKVIAAERLTLSEIKNADWNPTGVRSFLSRNKIYTLSLSLDGDSEIWIGVLPQSELHDSYKTSDARSLPGDSEGIPSRNGMVQYSPENGNMETETGLAPLVAFDFSAPVSDYVCISIMLILLTGVTYVICMLWDICIDRRIASAAAVCSLVVQFIFMIPNIVYTLDNIHLDPSWRYFLNIAGEEGYIFGKDVFFTYGPLGYLCYMINTGNSIRYWLGVIIWISIFAFHIYLIKLLYDLYKEGEISFIQILMSTLSYLCLISRTTADNYMLYVLVLSVVIYDIGRVRSAFITNIMLMIMFFGKFSTFTGSVAFLAIYITLRLVFCRDKRALSLIIPGVAGAPCIYLIYARSFKSLFAYVSGVLKISSGWMKTQQAEITFSHTDWIAFAVIVISYLVVIAIMLVRSPRKAHIAIAGCAPLFFAYKYGVVIHGIVAAIWLTSLLFSVLFLSFDPKTDNDHAPVNKSSFASVVLLCCLITALQAYRLDSNSDVVKAFISEKIHTATHLTEVSIDRESILAQNPVPDKFIEIIGSDTVTAYPWETGYKAVYPTLNIVYSPSVQNCNEFIPWLDRLSALYFAGKDAPEYLIVKNDTIHGHVKYMENPLTWEAIKNHYSVTDRSDEMYLLKKTKTVPDELIALLSRIPEDTGILSKETGFTYLGSETYAKDDEVSVPDGADYMVIHMDLSLAGKLKDFFWRAGPANISISYDSGQFSYGTVVYPNLISGLSTGYLPDTLDELEMVLNANSESDIPVMASFRFDGVGVNSWKDTITVDWYTR